MKTTVEVSARHIHLSKDDFQKLFGKDEMTKRNDLSQGGEFASEETVEVIGPKNRISKVRVLGPFRNESQLELSRTDCIGIGIDAPYLESGTGQGAKIKILGPKNELFENIAIIAMRHIHLSSKLAKRSDMKDGDFVSTNINGERPTTLKNIVVRVADNFANNIHLDTDDANAAGISSGLQADIIKQMRQE